MQIRIFVIPIKNIEPSETEMNRFLRGNRILAVTKEFVNNGENSFWSIVAEYLEQSSGGAKQSPAGRTDRIDYKEILSAEDFVVFSRLRDLRKQIANVDAVPVYTVFTNEQLAEMARKRPASKTALMQIEGVGEAKAQKYGQQFLDRIHPRPGGGTGMSEHDGEKAKDEMPF